MTGHNCPATGCTLNVAAHQLMCRTHWRMTPKAERDAVYAAHANGRGAGSPAHRAAALDAIGAVNAKIAGSAT